jgi:4,5-dihydroxyphthalate decarboxylase
MSPLLQWLSEPFFGGMRMRDPRTPGEFQHQHQQLAIRPSWFIRWRRTAACENDSWEESGVTAQEKVKLFTLLGDYPNTAALKSGDLRSDLVDFSFSDIKVANTGFKPLVREHKFDLSELAIVTCLQAKTYGKPYVLMPAVVLARGQHHTIAYNPERGPLTPEGLSGKRVGVRAYTVTTGVWVRGILQEQYGIGFESVKWVTFEDPHLAEYSDPDFVERAPAGKTIAQMLLDGELDAAVVGDKLPDPRLKQLIPNSETAAKAWADKHGYPLNHLMVVRSELSRTRPDVVREVFRLLKESRDAAVRAGNKNAADLQFGLEPNRRSLETSVDLAVAQKLIPRRFTVDELFDDTTRALT